MIYWDFYLIDFRNLIVYKLDIYQLKIIKLHEDTFLFDIRLCTGFQRMRK